MSTLPYVPPVIPGQAPVTGSAISSGSISTVQALSNFVEQNEKALALIPFASGTADSWSGASLADLTFIKTMTNNLNQALKGLNALVKVLTKVLQIVQLFISGFNSFSKLILAAINYTQSQLDQYASDAFKAGVYLNIIAPPAFYSKNPLDTNTSSQSRGGFNGFITRLQQSLNDKSDSLRPTFNNTSVVGGLVILLDTESLDEVYTGMKQLISVFDFIPKFGLQTTPPSPKNIQGRCGFFQKPGEMAPTYGVQIQWDQNYMSTNFQVFRSRTPQPSILYDQPYVPDTMMDNKDTGQPGLITVFKDLVADIFSGGPFQLPVRDKTVYQDPAFNNGGPATVVNNFVSTTLSYFDTDISIKNNVAMVPELKLDSKGNPTGMTGNLIPITTLYYVIQSSDVTTLIKGPYSQVITVPIKTCNDGFNTADVIMHPNSKIEYLRPGGLGNLGKWSSVQLIGVIPWFTEVIKELDKLINSVKGMITSASDSFSDFLNQIQKKVQLFIDIINAIAYVVSALEQFILGPSINFLELPPAPGGMANFVQRIQNAKPPIVDGKSKPFSGSNGISVGTVLVYGGGAVAQELATAIKFIISFFTKSR